MNSPLASIVSAAACALAFFAVGCASKANVERPLTNPPATIAAQPKPPSDPALDLVPAPIALDRSSWETVIVRVPVDAPEMRPTYATRFLGDPERSAAYPSPLSSLEAQRIDGALGRRGAALSIGQGLVDLVALVPRAIITPPWTTSPNTTDRYPRTRSTPWLPEVLGVQPLATEGDGVIRRVPSNQSEPFEASMTLDELALPVDQPTEPTEPAAPQGAQP